jgi:RNA recognition motif-containing protein
MAIPPPQSAGPVGAPNGEPEAIRNLMVNYIPTTIDEMQLRQLFEMYGPIESLKIVCDRETRQSRGYGFVKFRSSASAVHAIQYLNGYPLMNKRLKVAYANAGEAQKASQPAMDPTAYYQQNYMQQLAAMQMMQYQQMMLTQAAAVAQQQQPQQQQQLPPKQ